jgi:Kinase/pyrophosphorylase
LSATTDEASPIHDHGSLDLALSDLANADQAWWAPLRQLVISLSHGAEWNALMSTYIGTIPLSGDTPCAAEMVQFVCANQLHRSEQSSSAFAKAAIRGERGMLGEPPRVLTDIEASPGVILYTLLDQSLISRLEDRCRELGLPCLSVLGPVLSLFQSYLGAESSHKVGAQQDCGGGDTMAVPR